MPFPRLKIFYGGFHSSSYKLESQGQNIVYRKGTGPCAEDTQTITLDSASWDTLVKKLTVILRSWKKEYFNPDVCDGIQWEVKFKCKTFRCNISGSNQWPHNFDQFVAVIREISGLHDFAKEYDDDGNWFGTHYSHES